MTYKIEDVQGIGPAYARKLAAASISTTGDLLAMCCTSTGRKNVAAATGLSEGQLLKWSNMADLMRVSGIGPQFSELLEEAGVDTIKELGTRNPANLAAKMEEVNQEKHLSGASPTLKTVQDWVETAQNMIPMITY